MEARRRVAWVVGTVFLALGAGFPLIKQAADRARFSDRNRRLAAVLAGSPEERERAVLPYLSPDAEAEWRARPERGSVRWGSGLGPVRVTGYDRKAGRAAAEVPGVGTLRWRLAGREWLLEPGGMPWPVTAAGPAAAR